MKTMKSKNTIRTKKCDDTKSIRTREVDIRQTLQTISNRQVKGAVR